VRLVERERRGGEGEVGRGGGGKEGCAWGRGGERSERGGWEKRGVMREVGDGWGGGRRWGGWKAPA